MHWKADPRHDEAVAHNESHCGGKVKGTGINSMAMSAQEAGRTQEWLREHWKPEGNGEGRYGCLCGTKWISPFEFEGTMTEAQRSVQQECTLLWRGSAVLQEARKVIPGFKELEAEALCAVQKLFPGEDYDTAEVHALQQSLETLAGSCEHHPQHTTAHHSTPQHTSAHSPPTPLPSDPRAAVFDIHRDEHEGDVTVNIKLTADDPLELPSKMILIGSRGAFIFPPPAGSAAIFKGGLLYHASLPPEHEQVHTKLVYFFKKR